MNNYGNDPALVVTGLKALTALDTAELIGIRRMNTDETPSAAGSIAVAAGTITFYSTNDAATPEGGVGATNFPNQTGLAAGVLDVSAFLSAPATWQEIVNLINDQPNWEAWLITAIPDEAVLDLLLIAAVAATTVAIRSAGGYKVLDDTSVSDMLAIAITENGSTQQGKNSRFDRGFDLSVTGVKVNVTGTGALNFEYILCDDVLGTSETAVSLFVPATGVENATLFGLQGLPDIVTAKGKRIVLRATAATAFSAINNITATFRSRRVSAGIGKYYETDSG